MLPFLLCRDRAWLAKRKIVINQDSVWRSSWLHITLHNCDLYYRWSSLRTFGVLFNGLNDAMVYQNMKSDYIYLFNKVMAGILNLFPQKHLWRNWWSQSRDIGQIILPISARPPGNHISHLDRYLLLFLAAGGVPVIFRGNLVYL